MQGAIINTRIKEQTHAADFPRGILMIYSIKGKICQEEMSNEDIERYANRHNLFGLSKEDIIDKVIENFNNTLRPDENKRILKYKYLTYNATFYKKI